MTTDNTPVFIREMTPSDVEAVVELESRVFEDQLSWSAEELQQHLAILVAVDAAGRIVGSASSLIIDWDDYAESAKWSTITGHGTFSTHNPLGTTLYGADMCVDPNFRRNGIGSRFYNARKRMVRDRGLKRLLTGGRIPGYAEGARQMKPRDKSLAGSREVMLYLEWSEGRPPRPTMHRSTKIRTKMDMNFLQGAVPL